MDVTTTHPSILNNPQAAYERGIIDQEQRDSLVRRLRQWNNAARPSVEELVRTHSMADPILQENVNYAEIYGKLGRETLYEALEECARLACCACSATVREVY